MLAKIAPGQGVTRSCVQRWIEQGHVTIDGARGRAADRTRAGATIEVVVPPPAKSDATPDPSVVLSVLFEDTHLLVIDKPAGLVVHPAAGHAAGTLVNGLLARGGFEIDDEGDDRRRPGIVHRLDKGTSGVMVVAKDALAREGLKAQFARHDIERSYLAIVVGQVAAMTISTLHGRHPVDRLRFTTRVSTGKPAVTHVATVEPLGECTLVRCTLETGRTHQIRVHLAEIANAPALGDPLYGRRIEDPFVRELGRKLGHQALHAETLGFVHPITGERLRFTTSPPPDFLAALQALRTSARATPPSGGS